MKHKLSTMVMVALAAAPGCGDLTGTYAGAEDLAYMPEGKLAVFTPSGIKLHDAELGMETSSILLRRQTGGEPIDVPIAFDLSADGTVAAVAYSNTKVRDVELFRMPSGDRLRTIDVEMPDVQFPVQSVALSPTGDLVYVRGPVPGASGVYGGHDGVPLWTTRNQRIDLPLFSTDGSTLFGTENEGSRLQAMEARTGQLRYSVAAGGFLQALTLTTDGQTLVGLRRDCHPGAAPTEACPRDHLRETYAFWSAADGTLIKEFPQAPGHRTTSFYLSTGLLACSRSGLCASGSSKDERAFVLIWQQDGTLLHEIAFTGESVMALGFSPDGERLAVAGGAAGVYRVSDGVLLSERSYRYPIF